MDFFHSNMRNVNLEYGDGVETALRPICEVLGIAKISVIFYKNIAMEKQNVFDVHRVYEDKNIDENRSFMNREITGGEQPIHYYFYQYQNDKEWNKEYIEKILLLEGCIHSYFGRIRMSRMMDNAMFMDKNLEIHNLEYFFKYAGKIAYEGKLAEYSAVYFNLRHYSAINSRFGRHIGTKIMKKYVHQLENGMSPGGIIARIGGDNFLAFFKKEDIGYVKDYIEEAIVEVDSIEEKVRVKAAAGFCTDLTNCKSPNQVMDSVAVAFQMAKRNLKNPIVFYSEEINQMSIERRNFEIEFPIALEKEEFQVFYQPKVDLTNYKLVGAEALCRWIKDGNIVPPGKFIPILEQSNDICKFDFYILEHVCRDIRNWIDEGKNVVKVSVNLSRNHLGDENLLSRIVEIIDKYQVPHKYIEIELTETTTDVSYEDLKIIVFGLKKEGISTSVDDFGVGYSSMNLIRELPWTMLKIDKSFLDCRAEMDSYRKSMLKHIISLARDMGIECIAEGVETLSQIKMLKEFKCFLAQGFYFDKALPRDSFSKLI